LLNTLGIHEPVILIGYSTSASIARVFAGRHRDRVAGLALVDPYLPELESSGIPNRHGPWRAYARWRLHETLVTVFGIERLRRLIGRKDQAPPGTVEDQCVGEVLMRSSHAMAVNLEWFTMRKTASQVARFDGTAGLPLALVCSDENNPATAPVLDRLYRGLMERSGRASLHPLGHIDHSRIFQTPHTRQVLVQAVRDLRAR
jgi:pimeloyl-ACP methyl ester carboxylesterase